MPLRSLLQAEPPQLCQFFFTEEVLQLPPSLWSFPCVFSGPFPAGPHLSCTGNPRLDAILQLKFQQSGLEEDKSPPLTSWPHFFWCSPGYHWVSGCKCTLPAHIKCFIPKSFSTGLLSIHSTPSLHWCRCRTLSVTLLDFMSTSLWM